jgi:RNA polymerase sigma-70 factor (ECF subfamily)
MDMSIQLCLGTSDAVADPGDSGSGDGNPGIVLRDFLASNYARLHRRLLRRLGCSDQASDCLHDAWLRLGDMTIPATIQSPEAYVFRVACNVAMDRMRSNRLRQYAADADTELEQFPDRAPGPQRIAEARSDLDAVERAMQRLPRRHLAILTALRVDELTRDEVATRFGLSLRSVDTVLRQALDYCAQQTERSVTRGVRASRRPGTNS